jgi:hypothetical protein
MRYTYEITNVDEQARVMEVVYTHETHGSMLIGARLPYEGESLEAVIQAYSPVAHWRGLELAVVVPQVGLTGSAEVNYTPMAGPLDSWALLDNEVVL